MTPHGRIDILRWNPAEVAGSLSGAESPAPPLARLLNRAHPASIAVDAGSDRLTYGRLRWLARRFAAWLRERGVEAGRRIVVSAEPTAEFVVAVHGALLAGVTLVPAHVRHRARQWQALIEDAEPTLVLTGTSTPDEVPALRTTPNGGLAEAVRAAATRRGRVVLGPVPPAPAFLFYTSGSSGQPKGVVCTHEQVRFSLGAIGAALGYRHDDVVFCGLPLAFDYGFYQILLSAQAGARLVIAPPDATPDSFARLRRSGATVLPVVPSYARVLLGLARRAAAPTRVRLITNTGERLAAQEQRELLDVFPDADLALMYGLTECKRATIRRPSRAGLPSDSVGPPLPGTLVAVVDEEGGTLPQGDVGEIVLAGPHVTDGYRGAVDLSAERFTRCPSTGARLLRTGDFGYLDPAGELVVLSRRDGVYKSKGVRVSAAEVEAAALDVPTVRAALLVPPHAAREAVLWLESSSPPHELLTALRLRLEPAKLPRTCHVLEALPLTANGKLDRARAREWADEAANALSEAAPPCSGGTGGVGGTGDAEGKGRTLPAT